MADIPSRTILGLNQQTLQRLKLALGLNLRRQVFIAVCDDLPLRDRLASQLQADLTHPPGSAAAQHQRPTDAPGHSYPRIVSLRLNPTNPDPIGQIRNWLQQATPPTGPGRPQTPAFQFLGAEQITRQSAAVQRLFLTHLQEIERSLPALDSSLLLWLPQPWFRALPHSAPEFWRCRTAVFEFAGEPVPLVARSRKRTVAVTSPFPEEGIAAPPPTPAESRVAVATVAPTPAAAIIDPTPTPVEIATPPVPEAAPHLPPVPPEDLWKRLEQELVKREQQNVTPNPVEQGQRETHYPVAQSPADSTWADFEGLAQPLVTPHLFTDWEVLESTPIAPPIETRATPQLPEPTKPEAEAEVATVPLPDVVPSSVPLQEQPAPEQGRDEPPRELLPHELEAHLLQQVEALLQKNAPPTVMAEAYRALGDFYRDRIEQGEASQDFLLVGIHAYEQTLNWLAESSPMWSDVLNDLGNLYWMLSKRGDTADDQLAYLRQSIQSYQLALVKLHAQNQNNYPLIQNNLGAAFADLALHLQPAENLQRSVQAYREALRFWKLDTEPLQYATVQNNLGTSYWNLAQHRQPESNLEQAIAAYTEALRYYTPERDAISYAMIQNNLGTACWNLAQHEHAQDWLKRAIAAYHSALQYRTPENNPTAAAATQNNLGTACWHMATQLEQQPTERGEYLKQAIAAYEGAIAAGNRSTHPLTFDLAATQNNLGLTHYQFATASDLCPETPEKAKHLNTAIQHHLKALEAWQEQPDFRKTALNSIIQAIRALYQHCGIPGQNQALSLLPGPVLAEVLPKL